MSDLRFCPACGAQLPRVAGVPVQFCPGCGVRLEDVAVGPDAADSANEAAVDDGAGEGCAPSAAMPADAQRGVPRPRHRLAAQPRRTLLAPATLSSIPHAMLLEARHSRRWRCRGVGVSKKRILSVAVASTVRFRLA